MAQRGRSSSILLAIVLFVSVGVWARPAQAQSIESFVSRFYEVALGRPADPAGLRAWTDFLRLVCNPAGFDAVARGFYTSAEFRATPVTLGDLVSKLYQTMLGRLPDQEGLNAFVTFFRDARIAMARDGFLPSAEFQGLLPDRTDRVAVTALVTRLYTQILGRSPEATGLSAWVDFIVATGNLERVAAGFLGSAEFEARALTSEQFGTILYRTFLGRDPDAPGLAAWTGAMQDVLLLVINVSFIPSAEFRSRAAVLCPGPASSDIRGVYRGTLMFLRTNCPGGEGRFLDLVLTITAQNGTSFNAVASALSGAGAVELLRFSFAGTLGASGAVSGTFAYVGINTGEGVFGGTLSGVTLTVSLSGRDTVGNTCTATGLLTVSQ